MVSCLSLSHVPNEPQPVMRKDNEKYLATEMGATLFGLALITFVSKRVTTDGNGNQFKDNFRGKESED